MNSENLATFPISSLIAVINNQFKTSFTFFDVTFYDGMEISFRNGTKYTLDNKNLNEIFQKKELLW